MTDESKKSIEVACTTFMNQTIRIHHAPEVGMVSIEGSRVSLDLSQAEAQQIAQGLIWAGNGGHTGRPGS